MPLVAARMALGAANAPREIEVMSHLSRHARDTLGMSCTCHCSLLTIAVSLLCCVLGMQATLQPCQTQPRHTHNPALMAQPQPGPRRQSSQHCNRWASAWAVLAVETRVSKTVLHATTGKGHWEWRYSLTQVVVSRQRGPVGTRQVLMQGTKSRDMSQHGSESVHVRQSWRLCTVYPSLERSCESKYWWAWVVRSCCTRTDVRTLCTVYHSYVKSCEREMP